MAKKFWINTYARVWLISDEPLLLPCVGIEFIEWPDKAVIHGPLPHAAILNELQNGAVFEVLLYLEGTSPTYKDGNIILGLFNTRIKKRIERPVANRPNYDDIERIELKLILDCDIELFADVEL